LDINGFLAGILTGINSVVNNYGWSIVVFTLLIKVVLFPFDYKSRKSMRRMTKLQPEIAKLQKKYANDKEKLNLKTSELYRKEKINPLSGCVPMLITLPVLFAMFGAMRTIANTQMAQQVADLLTTNLQTNETWLWVKNLWMPDSPFATTLADLNSLKQIPAEIWNQVWQGLSSGQLDILKGLGLGLEQMQAAIAAATTNNQTLTMGDLIFPVLQQNPTYLAESVRWATMPELNLLIMRLPIYAFNNGLFLLPILAAVTQFLMTATQPQPAAAAQGQSAGTGAFMKYFFPLFSLYICSSYTAGFSLYWVMSNVIAWAQGAVLNKMFEAQERKANQTTIGEGTVK
jgi:YidC/Oxa1 family membrane protein insertase